MERRLSRREITLIVMLVIGVIATIILSVFLGIYIYSSDKYKRGVENVYKHAYYSLLENYVDIETNLSKMQVVFGENMEEELLDNICTNASLASLSLSTLNTENNELSSIFRFTNQLGDYSKYLIKKVANGEEISSDERGTLNKMHSIARKIGDSLSSVKARVSDEGYMFVDRLGKQDDVFSTTIKELNNGSIEYPRLIYDGPFSDGISEKKPKNLKGDKITKEQGREKIISLFDMVKDARYTSTNTNKFTSFLYDVTMKDDSRGTIQISEIGGHILMFASMYQDGKVALKDEEARAIGSKFLQSQGYEDMVAVYSSLSHGAYYVNFAPRVDGVIYYPDLIKVKISQSNGKVVGMESLNYIYNHVIRDIDVKSVVTEDKVLESITPNLDIVSLKLALIPKGVDNEILTYEIIGNIGENTYYIYLDAVTMKEVNVLMEIKSSQGNLLI